MILNLTDQNKLGFLAIAEEPAVMFLCEFLWDQFQSISTGTVERKAVFPEISKIMAHRYRFILRSFFVSGILAEARPRGESGPDDWEAIFFLGCIFRSELE